MPSNNNTTLNMNQVAEDLWMDDPINESMVIPKSSLPEIKRTTTTTPLEKPKKETSPKIIKKVVEHPKKIKKVCKPKKVVKNENNDDDYDNYYRNNDDMYKTLRNRYEEKPQNRRSQRIVNDEDDQYDNFFGNNFFDSGLNKTFRGMNNNLFDHFFF